MTGINLREALSTLADEVGPVDIEARVRHSARAIRVRRAAAVVAAVVAVVVAAAVGAAVSLSGPRTQVAPPRHTCAGAAVTLVVPTGGHIGDRVAIDPTGNFVVSGNVLWHDGEPSLIGDSSSLMATAVSASGDIAGHDGNDAWALVGGTMVQLAPLAGYTTIVVPTSINVADYVVGTVEGVDGSAAVLWSASGSAPRKLTYGGPDQRGDTAAYAMDESGMIVGSADNGPVTNPGHHVYPYTWGYQGRGTGLALPAGMSDGVAVQSAGAWVVGSVTPVDGGAQRGAVLWNLDSGRSTTFPGLAAVDVDRLGGLLVATGARATGGPYLLRGGQQVPLAVPAGSDPRAYTAVAMNTVGDVVVGTSRDGGGNASVVMWQC